jgi:hypothetical protein
MEPVKRFHEGAGGVMNIRSIEPIALARYPEATGVKNIQPFSMTDEKADAWFVILTTAEDWQFITTLVTAEDMTQQE